MRKQPPTDVEALIREIQLYLSYVEAFRGKPPARPPAEGEGENANG
jgi:hypothetical protein